MWEYTYKNDIDVPNMLFRGNRYPADLPGLPGFVSRSTFVLTADELQGGTYTLSNPGPFGTFFAAAIINQPQVAILSMDAIKKRPVVIDENGEDKIAIRPIGVLAHSFDHRAIDGAYSAAFLNRVKRIVEESDWGEEFE